MLTHCAVCTSCHVMHHARPPNGEDACSPIKVTVKVRPARVAHAIVLR